MMSTRLMVWMVILTTSSARIATAESNLVITAFHHNGETAWTSVGTNTAYRVEWAYRLDGPWFRSWQSLDLIEAGTNTSVHARVPMYYRVVTTTNRPPPGMMLVDAGAFIMGDQRSNTGKEQPEHAVFVSAFYIDKFEVSQALWDSVHTWAGTNGYVFAHDGQPYSKGPSFPVTVVSWHDCVKWCNARSEKEGLTPLYYTDHGLTHVYRTGTNDIGGDKVIWSSDGYRLPTEAEWEKAAEGGMEGHFYHWPSSGALVQDDYTNYIDGSQANYQGSGDPHDGDAVPTTPIGYYNGSQLPSGVDMANRYGIYDMVGNVSEWCWDWYSSSWYQSAEARNADTIGPMTGASRVVRGASWRYGGGPLYVRGWDGPTTATTRYGFRCVRRP